MKKIYAMIAALVLALAMLSAPSFASDPTEPCVPQEAWTEVIEHDAVTEEVYHEAVVIEHPEVPAVTETIPAVAAQHYSWTGGNLPTTSPPTVVPPHDDWQANTSQEPHDNGNGNPATWVNDSLHYTAAGPNHASWFYFTPAVPEQVVVITPAVPAWTEVVEEAYTEVVVIEEAWTETINHPAVTCEEPEEPEVPEEPEEPNTPEEPNEPEEPNTPNEPNSPVGTPNTPNTPTSESYCVGDALVTKTVKANGDSSTSTVSGHAKCAVGTVDGPTETVNEEGF